MADEVVGHAFSHGFHTQRVEPLAAYWAEALGGPNMYSESYGDEIAVAMGEIRVDARREKANPDQSTGRDQHAANVLRNGCEPASSFGLRFVAPSAACQNSQIS
jgi:hypothetical protein